MQRYLWQLVTVPDMTTLRPKQQMNNDLHIYLLMQLILNLDTDTHLSVCLFTLNKLYLQARVYVRMQ